MGLFFDFSPDRYPPGSFQTPVVPPLDAPGAEPLIQVCFNANWLPFILGAFNQLTMNTTWAGTDDEIQAARQAANNLIVLFQLAKKGCVTSNLGSAGAAEDYMLRQNPANPCELQSSVDGVTWCTWADLSLCTGQPTQPGAGSPNPPAGGGCTEFNGEVAFGSRWMLPNNVNTGDQVTVTDAVGTWASALDLYLPRCPDGNLFFEVGCIDGTGHTEPGDPAPTINHDSLIAFDGVNYYDCGPASDNTPVVITIGAGVSNANLFFFANTPDTTGFGSVTFHVKYCNEQAATFTHTFDFASNKFGWVLQTIETGLSTFIGTWTPGTGWVSSDVDTSDGEHNRGIYISITLPTTHITGGTVFFSYTPGDLDGHSFPVQSFVNQVPVSQFSHAPGSTVNGTGIFIANNVDMPGTTQLLVQMRTDDSFNPQSGSAAITKVVVTGIGADPFGGP